MPWELCDGDAELEGSSAGELLSRGKCGALEPSGGGLAWTAAVAVAVAAAVAAVVVTEELAVNSVGAAPVASVAVAVAAVAFAAAVMLVTMGTGEKGSMHTGVGGTRVGLS